MASRAARAQGEFTGTVVIGAGGGAMPVPDSATVAFGPMPAPALAVNDSVPAAGPVAAGEKVMVRVQLAPAASVIGVAPQVPPVIAKTPVSMASAVTLPESGRWPEGSAPASIAVAWHWEIASAFFLPTPALPRDVLAGRRRSPMPAIPRFPRCSWQLVAARRRLPLPGLARRAQTPGCAAAVDRPGAVPGRAAEQTRPCRYRHRPDAAVRPSAGSRDGRGSPSKGSANSRKRVPRRRGHGPMPVPQAPRAGAR